MFVSRASGDVTRSPVRGRRVAMSRTNLRGWFVAASALLVACSDPVVPDVDLFDVSVTVSDAEISSGEATELRATLRNPTNRELSFTVSCFVIFEIRDDDDDRFLEPVVCEDTEFKQVLGPGESLERVVLFDGTGWLTPSGPAVLPPGPYRVRAGMSIAYLNPSPFVDLRILSGAP
jgi:hypothetical protein